MQNTTGKYETVLIVDSSLGEEAVAALVEKFTTLISDNGTLGEVEDWGKRQLAYLINDKHEGHYSLIKFEAPKDFPAELERVYSITEGVLRYMVIALDK